MQPAKKIAIKKMARFLGWDSLAYDTMPNKDFNIWHFPQETRAIPATRQVVPNLTVAKVNPEGFERYLETHKQRKLLVDT